MEIQKVKEQLKTMKRQLFCKHSYKINCAFLTNGGMSKTQELECVKCGKIKYKTR